ncbi:DUF7504 family protein [Haladaptatus halobius]|uniref:DUF7504 family protein n=1 Tax=Haladaptatus halobius TaxID=2884875 RepID=UPI001D0A2B7B|nr:HalOD1 output domain-containing protein [Haladaptatus halobius]
MTSEQHPLQDVFQTRQCHQLSTDENSDDKLSIRLSEAMATVLDTDPLELTPLYNAIDPEALDEIFHSSHTNSHPPVEIIFSWHGHAICVRQTGEIRITDEPVVPQLDGEQPSSADFSADPSPIPGAISYEYTAPEDIGTDVVLAIADAVGVDPSDLREQLADRVNPDALTDLFRPKVDGTPRTGGYISFAFQGYFVTVSSDGTITLQSELAQLKHNGGNVLMVGDVPDDVFTTAHSILRGEPNPTQHDLVALLDRSPTALQQYATPAQPTAGTSEILDYHVPVRSAGVSSYPAEQFQNTQITQITGELADLQIALIQGLTRYEYDLENPEMTDFRLYFDSLRPILDGADTDAATFLQPIQRAVSAVGAVGYYLLSGDRTAPWIQELEADFNAVIELQVGTSGPEQRWSLRQTGYTTRWFSLDE